MTYKTHVAFAMIVAIPVAAVMNYNSIGNIVYFFAVGIGALAPDLDEQGSYLSRKIPIFPMLFDLFGIQHRGITHSAISIVFLILIGIVLFFINSDIDFFPPAYFGFILGYAMHIAGDMLTKGAIDNFFFPFQSSKIALLPRAYRFYTGSVQEYLVLLLFMCVLVFEIYLFGDNPFKEALLGFF